MKTIAEPFDGDPPERLLVEQQEECERIMKKFERWQREALKHGWNSLVLVGGYDPLTESDFCRTHREGSHCHALGMVKTYEMRVLGREIL